MNSVLGRSTVLLKKHPLLKKALPALILGLIAIGAFATTLFIKDRSFFMFPDNVDQFYAWYQTLASSLHHGILPLWDPNTFAGHSFVGEFQTGVFYPINLVWVMVFWAPGLSRRP